MIFIDKVYFAKVKPNAVIPTKRDSDAGYDIYANFIGKYLIIRPHETVIIPTGIASAFSEDYYFQLFERGSTGVLGIGQRCGVIDSNFRGEWKVPITNHNSCHIVIADEGISLYDIFGDIAPHHQLYPKNKAIAQAVLLPVPKVTIEEIPYEELLNIESERGTGMLGSSGK